jgi:hypothetical protein
LSFKFEDINDNLFEKLIAFSEKSDKWFRISKKYVSEKIYCLKEFQSQVNNVIEN